SLTVLPAMLAKLGRWVDRPRVPFLWRLTQSRPAKHGEQGPRFWPAVLRPALRHPAATLVVSVGLLLALALPALGMKLTFPGMQDLPRTTAAMQAYDRLVAAYPSNGTSHFVAVEVPAGQAEAAKAQLAELARRTQGDKLFALETRVDGEPKIDVSAD